MATGGRFSGIMQYTAPSADRLLPPPVSVMLGGTRDGKKLSASVEATHKEINDVLFRFFYKEGKGHNTYLTRFSNGLEKYWLGHLQAEYNLWHRIMLEGGATSVAMNLPDDKRAGLLKFLQLHSGCVPFDAPEVQLNDIAGLLGLLELYSTSGTKP